MPIKSKRRSDSEPRHYSDFRGGGLNLAASDRFFKENETSGGKNYCYERNGGRFRTLEPLELVTTLANNISTIYQSLNFGLILEADKGIYKMTGTNPVSIGALNGTSPPQFCDWGEANERKLFIASGSIIQSYDGTTYAAQTPIPIDPDVPSGDKWNTAHDVMVREGRLLLSETGKDRLKFSGVGDPTNWQVEDTGSDVYTDSDAIWVDIGYKEGGDIVKIIPLARDLVIFRTDGNLYRLFGSYPNWEVIPIAQEVDPVSRDTIVPVGNDIMFLDKDRGIRKLSAIKEHDDFAIVEREGGKVNSWLAGNFTSDAKLWQLPDRGEIWVRPNNGNAVLCWSERYQGWTKIDLGAPILAAAEYNGIAYLSIGKNLYKLNDSATSPAIKPDMELPLAPYFAIDRALVDYHEITVQKDINARATLEYGTQWTMEVNNGKTVKYQKIISDVIRPTLKSSGGTVVLDSLTIGVSEVV